MKAGGYFSTGLFWVEFERKIGLRKFIGNPAGSNIPRQMLDFVPQPNPSARSLRLHGIYWRKKDRHLEKLS